MPTSDPMLRAPGGDEGRAKHARYENGEWVGPWETERCPHGRILSFRWVVQGKPTERPTPEDFESSEPEYGRNGCKKCHPPEDEDEV